MLKVHIHSLEGETEIELKKDQDLYRLIIIRSKNHHKHEAGTVWHGGSCDEETIQHIGRLIISCVDFPHQPSFITILDGMQVNIRYLHDGAEYRLSLKEFEEGSKETELLRCLLNFCRQMIPHEAFHLYASSLENYFH